MILTDNLIALTVRVLAVELGTLSCSFESAVAMSILQRDSLLVTTSALLPPHKSLGRVRKPSGSHRGAHDACAHPLQRLSPRDGAASEPPRQLVEGVLLCRFLPGRTDLPALVSLNEYLLPVP